MLKPKAIILTGYGINCDDETRFACEYAGADAMIIHINDLIENKKLLIYSQILVFPGGFSYGDDTGSGKAMANRIKNNLLHEIFEYISKDTLILGICNGFQVMANIGIVPALNGFNGIAEVALEHNTTFRYQCRWVDMKIEKETPCIFTRDIDSLHIPVAHGEGNFYAEKSVLDLIEKNNMVAMRYIHPEGDPARGIFPFNPNGSIHDIAAICDKTGRIMGMMPHPERGIFFYQRDDWTYLKEMYRRKGIDIPKESDGIKIFRNAVEYFS